MPVTRRYLCDVCNWEWTTFHMNREEPFPSCPNCANEEPANIPGSFAITGAKSKAIDMAQDIMEKDYGFTNFHDNMREGDVAAMGPSPVQTAEAEQLTRAVMEVNPEMSPEQAAQVNDFWQKGVAGGPPPTVQQMAPAAAVARSEGADPVQLLHTAGKKGHLKTNYEVVARAKLN